MPSDFCRLLNFSRRARATKSSAGASKVVTRYFLLGDEIFFDVTSTKSDKSVRCCCLRLVLGKARKYVSRLGARHKSTHRCRNEVFGLGCCFPNRGQWTSPHANNEIHPNFVDYPHHECLACALNITRFTYIIGAGGKKSFSWLLFCGGLFPWQMRRGRWIFHSTVLISSSIRWFRVLR